LIKNLILKSFVRLRCYPDTVTAHIVTQILNDRRTLFAYFGEITMKLFCFLASMAAKGDWILRFHSVDTNGSSSERARSVYDRPRCYYVFLCFI